MALLYMRQEKMIHLGLETLTQISIEEIIFLRRPVALAERISHTIQKTYERISRCASSSFAIYGLNRGFGALAEKKIDPCDQAKMQKNIILSHAVGVGKPLDFFTAKTMVLLRLNTLIAGYSGASPQLIKHLLALLNADCAPLVPKKGSVGASGDLAPLAHLGLLMLGLGEAYVKEQRVSAKEALKAAQIPILDLGVRDGLALINGTQAMAASAAHALFVSHRLADLADITAASSLDALGGHQEPFDARIHQLKPHAGQILTAKNILAAIEGRTVQDHISNPRTQDPYSLRCVPQVHGASKDVIAHVENIVYREINSVTDNPLFFFNETNDNFDVLSGGNFHGQHLALALDYLAMAMAELANISERRIELLLNPTHSNGLPAFLTPDEGLNSGYMMLHVTASALVNENKVQCHPASVDSIPTSANREDHVSMGMTCANKLWRVIKNTKTVLAIELLAAHQAIDLRSAPCAGSAIRELHLALREVAPMHRGDCYYKHDLDQIVEWLDLPQTTNLIRQLFRSKNNPSAT